MYVCVYVCMCVCMYFASACTRARMYVCVLCIRACKCVFAYKTPIYSSALRVRSGEWCIYLVPTKHKTYTTIGTGWSHCQARQQTTTSTYRWLEGVARCKRKCVCMCIYFRMYGCTMHAYVCMYACMYLCSYAMHACMLLCVRAYVYVRQQTTTSTHTCRHLCTHSSRRLSRSKYKTPVGSSPGSHSILRFQMASMHSAKFTRP